MPREIGLIEQAGGDVRVFAAQGNGSWVAVRGDGIVVVNSSGDDELDMLVAKIVAGGVDI